MKNQSPAPSTRARRLGSRAVVAILATASPLGAGSAGAQRTALPPPAPAVRETATFQAGGTVFWLRATDAGKVLVYAARGFRTPFARPSTLSADETDRWAELAASLIAAADGAGPMPVLSSTSTHGGNHAGAVFGDGDLELEIPSADASPAVVIRVGAAGPEAISATLSAAVLREVVPALRTTARAAREMAATRLAAVGATRPARAFASVLPVTREEPAPIAAAPIAYVPAIVAPAPSTRPHSTAAAPALGAVAAGGTLSMTPSPGTPVAGRPVASAPSMDTARVGVGGLPSSTVGNVVRQRQPLLAYCYTAFGLASDSALSGRTTMRVALSRAGQVLRAEIVDRHWWGRGAEQVESCVRDRVLAWRFPAAARASLQEFQLYFNH